MLRSTLSELADAGNALEKRFRQHADDSRSREFKAIVVELRAWLARCVEQGRYLPPVSPDRRNLQGKVDYWTSRLLQMGQPFDDIDRIASFDSLAGHVLAHSSFPYHGLVAVTTAGGKLFFGREEQTLEYADHLEQHAALLIQSESGGGKSSIAMAGVLPELQRRHPAWRVVPRVTPGTHPADALRGALAQLLSPVALDYASVQAALGGQMLLVYVDQLEELLTMCDDVQQQSQFSTLLADLAGGGQLRLLATMRVDHYERLAHSTACHPLYALLTRDGSVKTLPPMSLAQIRSVILKPAEAVGLRFVPPSLVEKLANETVNTPSGLPLLQFALQRLWDERPRQDGEPLDMITTETFEKLPTVSLALSSVAETYHDEMAALGLVDACRRLMLELTVIDERLEVPLRRRRAEREVTAVLVNAGLASFEQVDALVAGLVERKLLVRTGQGAAQQIEVAHEALFRLWGRFQGWLNSDEMRMNLREIRQITRDALLWDQAKRSPDLLNLRGEQLSRALKHTRAHWLEPLAAAYVDVCSSAAQASGRQRSWLRVAAVVAVVVTLGGAYAAYDARNDRKQLAATSAANTLGVVYAMPYLKPLDALDLAYTLRQLDRPEAAATLAYAIDATGSAAAVGERKNNAAYFTPSGQAAFQFVSTGGQLHAHVRPLGAKLNDLMAPVDVPVLEAADARLMEDIAGFDVGPAIDDARGGGRLAAVTLIGPATDQRRELTRVRIYRLPKDMPSDAQQGQPAVSLASAKAVWLADLVFPNGTRDTSKPAFDESGTRVVLSAWLARDKVATQLMRWTLGDAKAVLDDVVAGANAVTAVAFQPGPGDRLLKGLQDGRVDCGSGINVDAGNLARVRTLKVTPGTSTYAAVHQGNGITVGNCESREGSRVQEPGSEELEGLALRLGPGDTSVDVSYVLHGKLLCKHVEHVLRGSSNPCAGHGWSADAALPVLDTKRQLVGYRALDRDSPLMKFLSMGTSAEDGMSQVAAGLPVATTPSDDKARAVASSPDGKQRVAIESLTTDASRTLRLQVQGKPSAEAELDAKDPRFAAINDQGLVVALARRGTARPHLLTVIPPDGRPARMAEPFGDAACMKLSPDGNHVLVASDGGEAKLLALNNKDLAVVKQAKPSARDKVQDAITACAVGNGPKASMVLASNSGTVRVNDPETDHWRTLSDLVPFTLNAAAKDVSIDAGSRFVAVVSELRPRGCPNGLDGHILRIWDLRQDKSAFPVASACITRVALRAIGPMQSTPTGWVLPTYHQLGAPGAAAQTLRSDFRCLACAAENDTAARTRLLQDTARALGAQVLTPEQVKRKYGMRM